MNGNQKYFFKLWDLYRYLITFLHLIHILIMLHFFSQFITKLNFIDFNSLLLCSVNKRKNKYRLFIWNLGKIMFFLQRFIFSYIRQNITNTFCLYQTFFIFRQIRNKMLLETFHEFLLIFLDRKTTKIQWENLKIVCGLTFTFFHFMDLFSKY